MLIRCLFGSLLLFVWLGYAGAEQPKATEPNSTSALDTAPTLDTVLVAWKSREQTVRSARFEWSATDTYVVSEASLDPKTSPEGLESPENQKVFSANILRSMVFDGQQLRYSLSGKRFASAANHRLAWVDQKYTLVLGDKAATNHFLNDRRMDPRDSPSTGTIYSEERGRDLISRNYSVDPIVMHYRCLDQKLSNIEGQLSLMSKAGVVEGRPCWIVKEDGGRPTEYWVDPLKDYAIVRVREFSRFVPDRCVVDTEVSYKSDVTAGSVPARWKGTIIDLESGNVRQSGECIVTSYQLNPSIDPGEFNYQYPPGTRVVDRRQSANDEYLVRSDGTKRIITSEESEAAYQDLLRTETGKAAPEPNDRIQTQPSNWFLPVGLLALLVVLILLNVARHRYARVRR